MGAPLLEEAAERVMTQPPMQWAWAETLGAVHGAPLRDAPFVLLLGGALLAFVPLLAVRRALVRARRSNCWLRLGGRLARSLVRGDRDSWAVLHGYAALRVAAGGARCGR